jgi:hypothetical protein
MVEQESGGIGPHEDARSSSKRGAAHLVGAPLNREGEIMGEKGGGDVSPQVEARSAASAGKEVEKVGEKVGGE